MIAAALAGMTFDGDIATRVNGRHVLFPFAAHRIAHALRLTEPSLTVARVTRVLTGLTFPAAPATRKRGTIFGWSGPGGHIVFTDDARAQITAALAPLAGG